LSRIAYGPERSQYGELFSPGGRGPHPVAVVIHGGFWKARYGRRLMHEVCGDLAARGWAAWNLEYRRLGAGGGWPQTLEDVAAGVDHLAHLDGLDLGRVVGVGHSAGGHLAVWAAGRRGARVPIGRAVGQAGVLDLRLGHELRLSNGIVERFMGGSPEEVPDRYAHASPAERLPVGVPMLLTHGALDEDVPPVMSERFAAAARASGDACELAMFETEGHMGHIDPASPMWQRAAQWLTS
jgi:acetyl esterase/lipase